MKNIICCDWGTTNFRLYLVDRQSTSIIIRFESDHGVAQVHQYWQSSSDHETRWDYYCGYLHAGIRALEQEAGFSLTGLPVFVAGMASSSMGMKELPYAVLPLTLRKPLLLTETSAETNHFRHAVTLVSGIKTDTDVMRGEETKLIGSGIKTDQGRYLCLLPGTHPKHAEIENGQLISFNTFLTGEFFALLSSQGILANSIDARDNLFIDHLEPFHEAVMAAQQDPLLSLAFRVRTNDLFGKYDKKANSWYLSGLLIGEELKAIRNRSFDSIYLVGGEHLQGIYLTAMEFIDLPKPVIVSAEEALVKGLLQVSGV